MWWFYCDEDGWFGHTMIEVWVMIGDKWLVITPTRGKNGQEPAPQDGGHRGPADRGKGQSVLFHRYGARLQQDKKGLCTLNNKARQFLHRWAYNSILGTSHRLAPAMDLGF